MGLIGVLAAIALLALQLYLIMKSSSNIVPNLHSSKCPNRVLLAQFCILLVVLAWWIAAACVFQILSQRAGTAGYPKAAQRVVVIACSWASVALLVSLLVAWLFLRYWLNRNPSNYGTNAPGLQMRPSVLHALIPSVGPQPPTAVSYAVPAAVGQQYPLPVRPAMQQRQPTSEAGVVLGIPLIPVPALTPPLPTPTAAARLAGASPASVQMAMISGSSVAPQRVSRLMTLPARQSQQATVARSLSAGAAPGLRPQLRQHNSIGSGTVGTIRVVNPSQSSV